MKKIALRNAKAKPAKAKTASKNAKNGLIKAKNSSIKVKNNPIKVKNSSINAKNNPINAINEHDFGLHPYWNPVYLGNPYVLNRNIPSYMPTNEADLVEWIRNYIQNAKTLLGTFTQILNGAVKVAMIEEVFEAAVPSRQNIEQLDDHRRSWNAYKNILFYAREFTTAAAVPPPPALALETVLVTSRIGMVGMIDYQVRELRKHASFNQTIAELLGIIPRRPGAPEMNALDPNLRLAFTGGQVEAMVRAPKGIPGSWLVEILCDRGDGNGFQIVATTAYAKFTDPHPLPAQGVATWTYSAQFIRRDGGIHVGMISKASILVSASQAGLLGQG